MRSKDSLVRFEAADTLARRGDRAARLAFEDILQTGTPHQRASAVRHLHRFSWFTAEALLRQELKDEDGRVQESAVFALCKTRLPEAYSLAADILQNGSDALRLSAVWSMSSHPDPWGPSRPCPWPSRRRSSAGPRPTACSSTTCRRRRTSGGWSSKRMARSCRSTAGVSRTAPPGSTGSTSSPSPPTRPASRGCSSMFGQADDGLRDRLTEVRCPVRLLVGTVPQEVGIRPEEAQLLAERLPHFEREVVLGVGHFIAEEAPGAIVSAVVRLAAGAQAAGREPATAASGTPSR